MPRLHLPERETVFPHPHPPAGEDLVPYTTLQPDHPLLRRHQVAPVVSIDPTATAQRVEEWSQSPSQAADCHAVVVGHNRSS